MKVRFDPVTKKWMEQHGLGTYQTTVARCPECGLYYKPSLGHMCKKRKNVWKKNESN